MKKIVKETAVKIELPHGAGKKVAEMAGVSIFTVSNVLSGKSKNTKVLTAIRDYLKQIGELKNEISVLTKEI